MLRRVGWDRDVRAVHRRQHRLQGFSLLTANVEVLHSRKVGEIATRLQATPPGRLRFARVGICR
jgi:hypothetical protein